MAQYDTCDHEMYPWEDNNGGTEYTCPKCAFEDLPHNIMQRFPQFRTKNICIHFYWKTNCKTCNEDTTIFEIQNKTSFAARNFLNKH